MAAGIHQVELRWTGEDQQGFSIVAHSEAFDSETWARRLQPIARPPEIRQSMTAVYKTFGPDAALIFRFLQRSAGSDQLPDQQNDRQYGRQHTRKDLVTRALTGPIELISPEVALAASSIGCPEFLDPPPGQVPEKASLPGLEPARLGSAVKTMSYQLDMLAKKDRALELVIRDALTAPTRPLTLQLPDDEVGTLSAIALLWGLWRTTGEILTDLPGWQWSFSTGEAPPGDTDPAPLPHLIIHRPRNPEEPPPTFERTERLIRPRAADAVAGTSEAATAAQLLAVAYQSLPFNDFSDRLQELRSHGNTLLARVAAIPKEFGESYEAHPEAAQDLPARVPAAVRGTSAQGHAPQASDVPPHEVPRPGQLREQPQALLNDVFHHGAVSPKSLPDAPAASDSFTDLFTQLAADDANSELALGRIYRKHELNQKPSAKERARLRALMAGERWFIDQLANIPTCDISRSVGLLLDLAVGPDVTDQDRRQDLIGELWRWVRNERTPTVVVLALDNLSMKINDYELQQALINAMGRRWRLDHGQYRLLKPPHAAQPDPGPVSHRAPRLSFFKDQQIPARWANVIVGICIIEMIVFAVLLAIRG